MGNPEVDTVSEVKVTQTPFSCRLVSLPGPRTTLHAFALCKALLRGFRTDAFTSSNIRKEGANICVVVFVTLVKILQFSLSDLLEPSKSNPLLLFVT